MLFSTGAHTGAANLSRVLRIAPCDRPDAEEGDLGQDETRQRDRDLGLPGVPVGAVKADQRPASRIATTATTVSARTPASTAAARGRPPSAIAFGAE